MPWHGQLPRLPLLAKLITPADNCGIALRRTRRREPSARVAACTVSSVTSIAVTDIVGHAKAKRMGLARPRQSVGALTAGILLSVRHRGGSTLCGVVKPHQQVNSVLCHSRWARPRRSSYRLDFRRMSQRRVHRADSQTARSNSTCPWARPPGPESAMTSDGVGSTTSGSDRGSHRFGRRRSRLFKHTPGQRAATGPKTMPARAAVDHSARC